MSFVEEWIDGPLDTKFFTRRYETKEPALAHLIFIHGFVDHIARYEHIFPVYVAQGISVFTLDQRGWGKTATDPKEKSPSSSYGKTSFDSQMEDLDFFINHEKSKIREGLPVFLMGQSMGGAEVLEYITSVPARPSRNIVAGVIGLSPLIIPTRPPPKWQRWVGGKVLNVASGSNNLMIPAKVDAKWLSHDEKLNEKTKNDPLARQSATLKAVADMLDKAETLQTNHKNWPADLPILIIHGTDDQVTSQKASEQFFKDLPAKDKKYSVYKGGYHELHNEPDGVGDRAIGECIAWVKEHAHHDHAPVLSEGAAKL